MACGARTEPRTILGVAQDRHAPRGGLGPELVSPAGLGPEPQPEDAAPAASRPPPARTRVTAGRAPGVSGATRTGQAGPAGPRQPVAPRLLSVWGRGRVEGGGLSQDVSSSRTSARWGRGRPKAVVGSMARSSPGRGGDRRAPSIPCGPAGLRTGPRAGGPPWMSWPRSAPPTSAGPACGRSPGRPLPDARDRGDAGPPARAWIPRAGPTSPA